MTDGSKPFSDEVVRHNAQWQVRSTSGGYPTPSQPHSLTRRSSNVALVVEPLECQAESPSHQQQPTSLSPSPADCIPPCIWGNLLWWSAQTSRAVDINDSTSIAHVRQGHARDRVLGWRVAMPVVAAICRYNLICSWRRPCGNGGRERCTNTLRTRTPNPGFFLRCCIYSLILLPCSRREHPSTTSFLPLSIIAGCIHTSCIAFNQPHISSLRWRRLDSQQHPRCAPPAFSHHSCSQPRAWPRPSKKALLRRRHHQPAANQTQTSTSQ